MDLERVIPDPGFAGDDGAADPAVSAALQVYGGDRAGYPAALAAVQQARVLVPVVAVLGEVEYDDRGLAREKTSDMATVLVTGRDGRRALLAFSSMAALRAWNPEARPVPVTLDKAAASAVQDGAEALVLDIAGPVMLPVEAEDLRSLAAGHRLQRVEDGWGWTRAI